MATEDDYLNTWAAIREGDIARLEGVIASAPEVVRSRLGRIDRTPLHVVTDWPGYFPNGPAIATLLIQAGAEIDPRGLDGTGETPLHWAASSDDDAVAKVLIDAGADIEAAGGSIGTPLDNAIGYGCWNVARLLVARGAVVDKPWQAAALGDTERLASLLGADPDPGVVNQAFWHACNGWQRRSAEMLFDLGADATYSPEYAHGTAMDAASGCSTRQNILIDWLRVQTDRAQQQL